ncbi:hypothetical protein ROZALSC1DRAFT_27338 [Rozella allomycis CSF55]|uniref:BHLH domain-containing protein n=1 Tax=Rozella allomycis (strain CSF55) TaxID=988480 RepID=A0A075B215_ROZAC|nr:hypothetical protein O9G_001989 [Rozella allomycis CSF55]RKP21238.1 hypothetical protein ROZALSC1DRAFT_27338 [Rozella allomycis CSF55]|eukprot:EPZ34858.1 hypothetical protein O9G_001989 [Rozella allomycis CSF55]
MKVVPFQLDPLNEADNEARKRHRRKLQERQARKQFNDVLNRLKSVNPLIKQNSNLTKLEIVQYTRLYIEELKLQEQELKVQNDEECHPRQIINLGEEDWLSNKLSSLDTEIEKRINQQKWIIDKLTQILSMG